MMSYDIETGLQPIIKWPGGKEKELKKIIPNIPRFTRYIEPFVGGGSVFMAVGAREHYINDLSSELIDLYGFIKDSDARFFDCVTKIDASWQRCVDIVGNALADIYYRYRSSEITKDVLKQIILDYFENNRLLISRVLDAEFVDYEARFLKELNANMFRKMTRMLELERSHYELPQADVLDNIEAAVKSALYMTYRAMYNSPTIAITEKALRCSLFFFIRNYAYSGMFRYSAKGDFNVPYGGIAYNSKRLVKKISYYQSEAVLKHFSNCEIFNMDFEEFLMAINPSEEDFVFLDPPYDTEFSTYDRNVFSKADQCRLADYLLTRCQAKWMLVIKNTDFIYGLYDKPGINIMSFDKKYVVSFMNRNDRNVTHLIITNYMP